MYYVQITYGEGESIGKFKYQLPTAYATSEIAERSAQALYINSNGRFPNKQVYSVVVVDAEGTILSERNCIKDILVGHAVVRKEYK